MTEHPDIFKKAAHENYINIPRLEKKVKQICAFFPTNKFVHG